ncbi:MAG: CAAX protease, partial [Veillonella caviae]|nr:CAAX protease [Veillonella caviae]
MAKHQRKGRPTKPKESTTSTTVLKSFFAISFISLGLLVFNNVSINWILGVFAVDIIVSLTYVILNKNHITESKVVRNNVRR